MQKTTILKKNLDNLHWFIDAVVSLKPYTIAFLIAEFFDFLTTYIGFTLRHVEGNPMVKIGMGNLLTFKLLVILAVVLFFQLRESNKKLHLFLKWLIVVIASLPVFWNTYVILSGF